MLIVGVTIKNRRFAGFLFKQASGSTERQAVEGRKLLDWPLRRDVR